MAVVLHPDTDFDQVMVPHPSGAGEIILVKVDGVVRAYRNSCPHVGVGLDYGDGRCLLEPGVLVCALHGARFDASDGSCFDGPCTGQGLVRVEVKVVDDQVILA